jgi:virginiamycin B lyase
VSRGRDGSRVVVIVRPEIRRSIRVSIMTVLIAGCSSGSPVGPTGSSGATTPPPTAGPSASSEAPSPSSASAPSYTLAQLSASGPAVSATVLATIPLDVFPGGPAVGDGALWFWDDTQGTIVRVDTTTQRVVATIPMGDPNGTPYGTPKSIAADGRTVWVSDDVGHAVARIDPATNKIVDRISLASVAGLAGPVSPYGLVIDGYALWVSDFDQSVVLRVDTRAKKVTMVVSNIDHPEGIAVGSGSVWVVEHRHGSLARIDPTTGTIIATVVLPGTGPHAVCGMCVDSVVTTSGSVWVPLDFGKGVEKVDPSTNTVSAQIPLGRVVDSLAIGEGAIWVAGWDGSIPCTDARASLTRIDEVTNIAADVAMVPCAVTVGITGGDVWVGTADAPNGVTRLKIGP